jgi:hypothetical protein
MVGGDFLVTVDEKEGAGGEVTCEIFTVIRSSSSSRDWLVATFES